MRLTIEGGALYTAARRILAESDQLMAFLRELREGPQSSSISGIRQLARPARGQAAIAAETVLAETEALFAHIFHANTDGIILSRVNDGLVYDANEAYCEMIQWPRDQVLGSTSAELGVWADEGQRARVIEVLRRERSVGGVEVELVTRAGEVRHAEAAVQRIELAGEQRFLSTFRDITAQKSAERTLGRHAAQQTAIAELAIAALAGENFKALSQLAVRHLVANSTFTTGAIYQALKRNGRLSLIASAGQHRPPRTTSLHALLKIDQPTAQQVPVGAIIDGISTPNGEDDSSSRCWYRPIGSEPARVSCCSRSPTTAPINPRPKSANT